MQCPVTDAIAAAVSSSSSSFAIAPIAVVARFFRGENQTASYFAPVTASPDGTTNWNDLNPC